MEVTLQQILDAREARAQRQKQLLQQYKCTLVCFTMNIAGPVKNTPLITQGFKIGIRLLETQLAALPVLHKEQHPLPTGCEAYYLVQAQPETVKELTVNIEETIPVARLFDMDVFSPAGEKIDRQALGYPPRQCLLCQQPAHLCSRSRTHTVEQLWAHTARLLENAVNEEYVNRIACLAQQSLLYEVCTTPKPGLVDCQNNGSHKDMDIFTFMASSAALQPYFAKCAQTGIATAHLPAAQTFRRLRLLGKLAEQDMRAATDGVNTHKGAIFSLGLACGAAGRLGAQSARDPERLLAECRAMTQGLVEQELGGITQPKTAGEKLYLQHHITGVRGQAEAGFPAVLQTGLPALSQGLANGFSLQQAGCGALLALLAATEDTNLIARSDYETQQRIQKEIAALIAKDPYPDETTLQALDQQFQSLNLSPGGSADLLAITYFVLFLSQM